MKSTVAGAVSLEAAAGFMFLSFKVQKLGMVIECDFNFSAWQLLNYR